MSQEATSTLLPSSRVDFFVLDDGTAETAGKLSGDWRFARVGVQVERSGIEAAIAKYGQYASPELIVIETNDISDAFIAQLGQLAGVCAAGTDAIIVGPMNDVHLYRSLVSMGVKDYLVRPVSEEDFINVIAKALIEKKGISSSRLVAVMGAKGGVGATSMSQVLAWNVAERLMQKTVLMDVSGSSGTIGISCGLEPTTTLAEALRVGASGTEDDMKRIVQSSTERLSVLVSGGDPMLADVPDADNVETLVNRLMQKFPVVIVDLSGAAPAVQKRLLARAGHVVLVSTPLLPSLRNSRTLIGEIKSLRGSTKDIKFVLNNQGIAGSDEVPAADIKMAIDLEPVARIPHAPKVFAGSEAAGKIPGSTKSSTEIAELLLPLASMLSGKEAADAPKGGGKEDPLAFFKKLTGKKR